MHARLPALPAGRAARAGLVAAGYAAAFALAWLATTWFGADPSVSDGMAAFGDSLLFLGVFALASLPASVLALMLLRQARRFWSWLAYGALLFAAGAVAAIAIVLLERAAPAPALHAWSALALLRLIACPAFAPAWLVAALVAPAAAPRRTLLAACALEAGAFALLLARWILAP